MGGLDIKAIECANLIAEFEALRIERDLNGPTKVELLESRIAELEEQRDKIYLEVAGWIKDMQTYFPRATGLYDVIKEIENLETRNEWLKKRITYAEWDNKNGVSAHHSPPEDGFYDRNTHGEEFDFLQFVDFDIEAGK